MPELTRVAVIDAAPPSVAAALRIRMMGTRSLGNRSMGRHGTRRRGRNPGATGYPTVGIEVRATVPLTPLPLPLRWRFSEVEPHRLRRVLVRSAARHIEHIEHTSTLTATAEGTRVTETVRWDATPADALVRRLLATALRLRLRRVGAHAARLRAAPAVVAAAVLRDGRVLAQQRARPAALAGRWELPGGRVEPGEDPRDALVRECREELAVLVTVGAQLGPDVPLPSGRVLRVHTARLADPAAHPVAVEHSAVRWVGPDELRALDWLDADLAVVPDLTAALLAPPVP